MEFFQNIYNFFSTNIVIVTIVLVLGVIATILEKSQKIATPIQSMIQKSKVRKKLKEERWIKFDNMLVKQEELVKSIGKIDDIETKLDNLGIRVEDQIAQQLQFNDSMTDKMTELESKINGIDDKVKKVSTQVSTNERDRLRGELFNCGSKCRRGIPLTLEEFRFISAVYEKYSVTLHENSIGTDEYEFIKDYFNRQSLNNTKL